MKKIIFLGILIFIVSVGVGYIYSSFLVNDNKEVEAKIVGNEIEEYSVENITELRTIEAVSDEKKVTPNMEFGVKEYYDECGHFKFEYKELPNELMNLSKQEVEDYYEEYEVEEFEDNTLILSKEINGLCNDHFLLKLQDEHIEIYKLNSDGSYSLHQTTEITKEYLPAEDIEKLEEGIYIYGEGMINASLEDFE